ncbi:hypothetical protein A2866_05875 [Candidatus Roizmanbacteria bacterium RIFCSPHIGHO2_01_FULL_39_8]|uniref:HTH cro/C1-type domain-containing protein n=3 Tax=Candidatus Roizmaniibacteriota TaxID=1752723 RepID=A0A1F7GTZ0_9BACT|nr:MAG: hypothetical protein A2866_05875 [Candidatus Roizmanbacteria bacterium RIFCSPHIGHO2_01_FULL_39_8]OGK27223.1 MAG: hypothetical protein A3C28_04270 [Candidatus Roizmanbacteria bacterium RIFCSPHIGHO2_02_FULL_39_9]OGK37420.1 MAG: hypothetical protein A3F60_00625 [Candidatus Roizmanbacteria bacterium RIFCSPHIGHO2_12_FULL_39_8]
MNSPETRKKIGNKLKEAREKANFTQEELAQKAGLSTNYYACVERGEENISAIRLAKLEEVLDVKILNI